MSAFMIEMANKPGELARICEILAASGVNLVVCGLAHGDGATVAFIADDEDAARGALQTASVDYVEREALTVRLENRPGAGADAFRTLAGADVNLDLFLPVRIYEDQFYAVICPDNMEAAAAALGERVVAG